MRSHQEFQCYLSSLNSKYKMDKVSSDSILQEFSLDPQEIFFVYKEPSSIVLVNENKAEIFIEDRHLKVKENLEGSPLPAPFSQSDLMIGDVISKNTKNEEQKRLIQYDPLPLSHARLILSKNNTLFYLKYPVYILTDGEDSGKTIMLSSQTHDDGWVDSMAITIDSSCMESNSSFVNNIIEEHCKRAHMSPLELQSTVKSIFTIQDVMKDNNVELHITWDTPSIDVPVSEAMTDLILNCKIGNKEQNITSLWFEIQQLVTSINLIKKWKSNLETLPFERNNAVFHTQKIKVELDSSNAIDIPNQILKIINDTKSIYNVPETRRKKQHTEYAVVDVTLNQLCQQVVEGRPNSDLSDKLWSILSECHNYKELASNFHHVFQQLRLSIKEDRSKINISNKKNARFICAVRNLLEGDNSNPEIFWEQLEILVEMGIEKLKDDYSFVFLKINLVEEAQLYPPSHIPKFAEMSGDDWLDHMYNYIDHLTRLHVTLSIICQVDTCLKVPLGTLSKIAYSTFSRIQAISYEEIINNESQYRFTCPVSTLSIEEFVTEPKLFDSWRIHLSHENTKRRCTSTTLLTMKPLLLDSTHQHGKIDANVSLAELTPFHHYRMTTNSIKFPASLKNENVVV